MPNVPCLRCGFDIKHDDLDAILTRRGWIHDECPEDDVPDADLALERLACTTRHPPAEDV